MEKFLYVRYMSNSSKPPNCHVGHAKCFIIPSSFGQPKVSKVCYLTCLCSLVFCFCYQSNVRNLVTFLSSCLTVCITMLAGCWLLLLVFKNKELGNKKVTCVNSKQLFITKKTWYTCDSCKKEMGSHDYPVQNL